jgi:hypothetical protein
MNRIFLLPIIVCLASLTLYTQHLCPTTQQGMIQCDAGSCHQRVWHQYCWYPYDGIIGCTAEAGYVMCCGGHIPSAWAYPCGIGWTGPSIANVGGEISPQLEGMRVHISSKCRAGGAYQFAYVSSSTSARKAE